MLLPNSNHTPLYAAVSRPTYAEQITLAAVFGEESHSTSRIMYSRPNAPANFHLLKVSMEGAPDFTSLEIILWPQSELAKVLKIKSNRNGMKGGVLGSIMPFANVYDDDDDDDDNDVK